eukprot:2350197-Amphidinium_carterae.1
MQKATTYDCCSCFRVQGLVASRLCYTRNACHTLGDSIGPTVLGTWVLGGPGVIQDVLNAFALFPPLARINIHGNKCQARDDFKVQCLTPYTKTVDMSPTQTPTLPPKKGFLEFCKWCASVACWLFAAVPDQRPAKVPCE